MPNQRPSSVIFLAEDPNKGSDAQVLYRAMLPAWGLAGRGLRSGVYFDVVPGPDARLCGLDKARDLVTEAPDVFVLRRPERDVSTEVLDARMAGQQVWIDLDDDVWHLRRFIGQHDFTDTDRAVLEKNLAAASGALCSTPALAEVVRSRVLGITTQVCPPSILTPKLPRPTRTPGGRTRLGWMGSTRWRGVDLRWYGAELLAAVEPRRERLEFWHVGHHPEHAPVTDYLPGGLGLPLRRVPWMPIAELPAALRATLDVMVLPQEPGPFNEARSITSGLAAAAAGVPFTYTETGPFIEAFGPSPELGELLDSRKLWRERRAWGYRVATAHHPRRMAAHYLEAFAT
jgi:hypothetical protein